VVRGGLERAAHGGQEGAGVGGDGGGGARGFCVCMAKGNERNEKSWNQRS
jgi:hypothetical protein